MANGDGTSAVQFVHRDIKPGNLLVDAGDPERVRLADFRLARVYQTSKLSGLTVTGEWGGTLPFMAPEQITNFREAKPVSDQYAAAATLYNLLTNYHVYDWPKDKNKWLLLILEEDPVPIQRRQPTLPDELASIIHRA